MAQPTSSAEQEGQPSFLERPVPLWLVLFIVLLGGLFTLAFGWAVLQSARGNEKTGMIGDGAVIVANFPSTVKAVFTQLISDLTGAEERCRLPGAERVRHRRLQARRDGWWTLRLRNS